MFDYQSYFVTLQLREQINKSVRENQPYITTSILREIDELEAKFAGDVLRAEQMIEEARQGDYANIKMPTPSFPIVGVNNVGEECALNLNEYVRQIPLPHPKAPFYRAVRFVEAESLVREWCEIMIEKNGLK
jgi:hypothetical protein